MEAKKEKSFLEENRSSRRVDILGVGVNPITLKDFKFRLKNYLSDGDQHFIATVNPEFVIQAQKDKRFFNILGYTDLNVTDGIGILWASKYLKIKVNDYWIGSRVNRVRFYRLAVIWQAIYSLLAIIFYPPYIKTEIPGRIKGLNIVELLVSFTEKSNHSVYLLGGKRGIANAAKKELEKKFPKALITGCRSGYLKNKKNGDAYVNSINKVKPDILVVALGSPKQEKWIFDHMDQMSSVKIAVGAGGVLDFIAKNKKRAPAWMRKKGLEWLFRFYLEPKRLPRIKKATFQFIKEVIKHKISAW